MDADRLVRYNKTLKNKTEATKMKSLLETIAYKNKQTEFIESLAPKSKSKSKTKIKNR
jgi:hypothetical protein